MSTTFRVTTQNQDGANELAVGEAAEVAAAVAAYGGWLGTTCNVYAMVLGFEPFMVDQIAIGLPRNTRTRFGHELRANTFDEPTSATWGEAAIDADVFKAR